MRIRYVSTNGRLEFEGETPSVKEAFEWLSTIQELFEENACGLCGKDHLTYEVREFDGNNYYKLVCRDCHATLDFGQRRDGANLFIKRKDADGNPLPNRGWYRYQGAGAATPAPAPSSRSSRRDRARRPDAQSPKAAIPF
ncbi:MAG: hypothetical protein KY475_25615 [Planctomycetes bacterium]|nr:hypothetical protein [Planctomycetota bacterium]